MKRVLVLMSTYNGSKYIDEQIQSILGQTDVECSLLIRDDGSTDDTIILLQEIADHRPKGAINVLTGENVGVYNSFTALIQHASRDYPNYDYYAFSDQDDIWLPEKIASAVDKLKALPSNQPLAYCSNATLVDNDRNRIRDFWKKNEPAFTKDRVLFTNYAQGCTMVFNKNALNMYCEKAFNLGKLHDYMLALICIYYGEIVYDEHSFLLYRQHDNNVIGGNKKQFNKIQILRNLLFFDSKRDEFCNRILEHFKDLNDNDLRRIKRVAYYKKSIWGKLRLLCYPPVYFKSFKENLLIGARVLFGTF